MSKKASFQVASVVQEAVADFGVRNAFVEHYDWGPSLTRQEMAEDCDINTIMARYEVTGNLHAPYAKPDMAFMDVTDAPDLMTALKMLEDAKASFMLLPAKVRREFDNDPIEYVAFAQDPVNLDQMREWGLAPPAPAEPPQGADRPVSEASLGDLAEALRQPPKPA